jgi:hypothetical protein
MPRFTRALVTMLTVSLVGCQWPSSQPKDDAEKRNLEKRIAELEERLQATAAPTVEAAAEPSPTAAPAAESAPAPRRAPATTIAARPAPTVRPTAAAPVLTPVQAEPKPAQTAVKPAATAERTWTIPDGSELTLVFETEVSSERAAVGDVVVTRIERALDAQGRVSLPGGSVLKGSVSSVKASSRVKGKAFLAFKFNHLTVRGHSQSITPFTVELQGQSDLKRDGAMVAGGAVAGAVVGGILGGNKGAKRGAAIGAAGGAGAAVATKGETITLNSGDELTVVVSRGSSAR